MGVNKLAWRCKGCNIVTSRHHKTEVEGMPECPHCGADSWEKGIVDGYVDGQTPEIQKMIGFYPQKYQPEQAIE